MKSRFYKCDACGNQMFVVVDSGMVPVCCGSEMVEMVPETDDKIGEKHVPVVCINGHMVSVDVGSIPHPMDAGHYIEWVSIETNKGMQLKHLEPGCKPEADFMIVDGERLCAVYAFCSLHGFWKCVI